jgi:hypothetical protein
MPNPSTVFGEGFQVLKHRPKKKIEAVFDGVVST